MPSSYADNWVLPLSPWGCPASGSNIPAPSEDKDKDGKPDRKYIHIVDKNGRDIQEWCLDHGPTGDYAYYISSPGKNDTYVGGCLLLCGINDPVIVTDGPVTINTVNGTETIDPDDGSFRGMINGTITGSVNGTISIFNHTNYVPRNSTSVDAGKNYHFIYNFTSGEAATKITTMVKPNGEHEIIMTEKLAFIPHQTPDGQLMGEELGFLESSFPDFRGSMLPGSRSGTPDVHVLKTENIVRDGLTFTIFYSSTTDVDDFTYDPLENSLLIQFPQERAFSTITNLSIPRDLLDHRTGERFQILVDGEIEGEFEERTSLTHRTLTIFTNEDTSNLLISGTTKAKTSQLSVQDTNFVIGYQIIGGNVSGIFPDIEERSLIMEIDAESEGELTVKLPRQLIDAREDNIDDEFVVFANGDELDFVETKTSTERTLTIVFPEGTREIKITGTSVIPEFNMFATLVFAIAAGMTLALFRRR
jgi:hypothetical protein